MIGVFDSGLGGVLTATYINEHLPAYDLFVLADKAYAPYGEKDNVWIRKRTFSCLERMFDQGCSLVILACNTASTTAIHAWQELYPEKKVLSITVPGIEEVIEQNYHHIGVLATQISVTTNLYPDMFARHYQEYPIHIEQVIGSGLVEAIEGNEQDRSIELTDIYAKTFTSSCEAVILGCTHYPLIAPQFIKKLPDDCVLINPGALAAEKLVTYLHTHRDLAFQCSTCVGGGNIYIHTTQMSGVFTQQCEKIQKKKLDLQLATIS